jgi:hypothetical protein
VAAFLDAALGQAEAHGQEGA